MRRDTILLTAAFGRLASELENVDELAGEVELARAVFDGPSSSELDHVPISEKNDERFQKKIYSEEE